MTEAEPTGESGLEYYRNYHQQPGNLFRLLGNEIWKFADVSYGDYGYVYASYKIIGRITGSGEVVLLDPSEQATMTKLSYLFIMYSSQFDIDLNELPPDVVNGLYEA